MLTEPQVKNTPPVKKFIIVSFQHDGNELRDGAHDNKDKVRMRFWFFVFFYSFFLFSSPNIWDLTHTLKSQMLHKIRLTRWSKSVVVF